MTKYIIAEVMYSRKTNILNDRIQNIPSQQTNIKTKSNENKKRSKAMEYNVSFYTLYC